jgi:rod shape-determining protein MreD
MKGALWLRIQAAARHAAPVGMTLGFLLIGAAPLQLPLLHALIPSLPLIALFYWSLYRPELMPTVAVFVLGLLEDAMSGAPLGVHALTFMIVKWTVVAQRRFFAGKPFEVIWLGFSVVVLVFTGLSWMLTSAIHLALLDGSALLMQAVVTIGMMPVVWRLLIACHIGFLKRV